MLQPSFVVGINLDEKALEKSNRFYVMVIVIAKLSYFLKKGKQ